MTARTRMLQDARVLIIEDDDAMLRGLEDNFAYEGCRVLTARDGEKGLELALHRKPDLIILDIMLPAVNGFEICRVLRGEGFETPIIMLTAKGEESDVVLGLNLGADDYITKPFSIRELLARAGALLRRSGQEKADAFRFGEFQLDRRSRRLTRSGDDVELTPKEFGILCLMLEKAGRALTREAILSAVWGWDAFVTRRSVDRCINTLRGKIEADPARPCLIQTVREVGYRFDADALKGDEGS